MKFLLSFVLLIPMLAAAAAPMGEIERMPGGGHPQPGIPNPRYCPDGTHRVYDEYKGRYICVADDYGNEPRPMPGPWCGTDAYCPKPSIDPMERMSGQLKAMDLAVETGSLDGFFDAALGKSGNADRKGVVQKVQQNDPSWGGPTGRPPVIEPIRPVRPEPIRPEPPRQDPPRQTPPPEIPRLPPSVIRTSMFVPARDGARFITVGDTLGNWLRDRNDKKLEDATKQQKDTEKAWKDYKEGKSVRPHPPTADEITTSRKG